MFRVRHLSCMADCVLVQEGEEGRRTEAQGQDGEKAAEGGGDQPAGYPTTEGGGGSRTLRQLDEQQGMDSGTVNIGCAVMLRQLDEQQGMHSDTMRTG